MITREYKVNWKIYNEIHQMESYKERIFSDIQWKDYGVRVTDDIAKETFIIPYTSIGDIQIIETDSEKKEDNIYVID